MGNYINEIFPYLKADVSLAFLELLLISHNVGENWIMFLMALCLEVLLGGQHQRLFSDPGQKCPFFVNITSLI